MVCDGFYSRGTDSFPELYDSRQYLRTITLRWESNSSLTERFLISVIKSMVSTLESVLALAFAALLGNIPVTMPGAIPSMLSPFEFSRSSNSGSLRQ